MRGKPFQRGNPGGPGRPPRTAEEKYLDSVTSACAPADLKAVTAKVLEKARAGDMKAAALLFKVLLGDDPLLTRRLVGELTAELERIRTHAHRNGHTAAAGGSAEGRDDHQPAP